MDERRTHRSLPPMSSGRAAAAPDKVGGAPPQMRRKISQASSIRKSVRERLFWIPLGLLAIWTLGPLLITLSVSLKTSTQVFASPGLIPDNPSLTAYWDVIARPGFRMAFVNSIVIGFGTLVLTLLLGVPAAYAFARFGFRGRHLLLLFILLPRLVPSLGLMVPLYRLAAFFGVLDSRLTLIVVFTGLLLPLAVWLMTGFFRRIPRELEDAAAVDGATLTQRLRFVVMPLALPALITVGVLAFREAWNEFELVLVLSTSADKRTLPYELFRLNSAVELPEYPLEAAFALLTVVPLILIYMRIERYVVGSMTTGAVK